MIDLQVISRVLYCMFYWVGTLLISLVSFSEVKMMPDLMKDPRDWFAVCDVDFGGELDPYEVAEMHSLEI